MSPDSPVSPDSHMKIYYESILQALAVFSTHVQSNTFGMSKNSNLKTVISFRMNIDLWYYAQPPDKPNLRLGW